MPRPPSADPWAKYRMPLDPKCRPHLDWLRDEAIAAASDEQRQRVYEEIILTMLTYDVRSHPGITLSLRVSDNRDLLLKRAKEIGFEPDRGTRLDEFARSHMRGEGLDDGSPAVEFCVRSCSRPPRPANR